MSEVVVGIRGLMRGKQHWGNFAQYLEKENSKFRFIPLELPGNGERWNESSISDPQKLILELRKQLPPYQKISLVGISLGGIVALKWAELFPQEVSRVFLVNSSLSQLSPFYHRLHPKNYKKILSLLFCFSPRRREIEILKMTSNKRGHVLSPITPLKRLNFFRQLLLALRIRIHYLLNQPVIITCIQDQLVSPKCSMALAERYQAPLLIHPTAGHDLALDDPLWLAQQISRKM